MSPHVLRGQDRQRAQQKPKPAPTPIRRPGQGSSDERRGPHLDCGRHHREGRAGRRHRLAGGLAAGAGDFGLFRGIAAGRGRAFNGRRAMTHCCRLDQVCRQWPQVDWQPNQIHVSDGPIWTSAGVTVGMDLALIRQDHDAQTALAVVRQMLASVRRPATDGPRIPAPT